MPLEVGTTLGPYTVTAKIGEGGMGEVYRARDTKLDRDVALKVLPQAFGNEPDGVRSWKWLPSALRASLILVLTIVSATVARGSELSVSYGALERNISVQLMTQEGRYYMQGDPSTPCAHAFVQDPRVDALEGRLRIRLLFSGSAATSIRGRCVGAGDNFDLTITGVPTYANGELHLDQMSVQATAAYFKVVSALVEDRLRQNLRVALQRDLERAATWMSTRGRGNVQLTGLEVLEIAVEQDALRFTYDITTSIR